MTAVSTSARPAVGTRRTRARKPRNLVAHLFLGALIIYFLIPIWWLFVASSKDAPALFSGSGALWFGGP